MITGNWGQDIALLLKGAADAGLQTDWYTYYAGGAGGPTAIRQTGLSHRIFEIVEAIPNSNPAASQKWEAEFRAKEGVSLFYPRAVNEMRMLAKAVNQAKFDDPKAIAPQLEGMKTEGFDGGEIFMRKDDHQLFQDMYIASFGPLDPGAKFDEEGTGWGWKTSASSRRTTRSCPRLARWSGPDARRARAGADIDGVCASKMVEGLIAGGKPDELAALGRGKVRATTDILEAAMDGELSARHRLVLDMAYDHLRYLEGKLAALPGPSAPGYIMGGTTTQSRSPRPGIRMASRWCLRSPMPCS